MLSIMNYLFFFNLSYNMMSGGSPFFYKILFLILICLNLMFNSLEMAGLLMIFSGVEIILLFAAIVKSWFHVIMMMLILEMLGLIMFKLFSLTTMLTCNSNIMFFFITLMVIEASLGLGLVVNNSRSWNGSGQEI